MTAHTAKGLEWDHVFILRATSDSFPWSYKPPLFEFPADLREDDSIAQNYGQTLHEQEERRLFYVAMTRARDSLAMYAQQGRGKKDRLRRVTFASCCRTPASGSGFAGGRLRRLPGISSPSGRVAPAGLASQPVARATASYPI